MLINYEGKKLCIYQVLDVEERHAYIEITATWKGEMWSEVTELLIKMPEIQAKE